MAIWNKSRTSHTWQLGLTLLVWTVVGVAVLYSACGGGQTTTVSREITAADGGTVSIGDDIVVRIPPGALSTDTTITITKSFEKNPAPGELEHAEPVGDAFEIDIGGAELLKSVTLEIAFDPGLLPEESPQDAVFLAFYDEDKNEWVPLYGTVDLARHVLVVQTDHLSWWQPWTWDFSALGLKITQNLESLLELGGLPVAEIPECTMGPRYMSVEFDDSLLVCIQDTGAEGTAILKLANNRAFGILVNAPEGVQVRSVSHGSLIDEAWRLLTERFGQGAVYIPPAEKAEFLLEFEEAGEINLFSAPSDLTLAGDMLIAIVSALGANPDNVVDGLRCLFEIMTPERQGTPTIGDLFDVVKDCVGVALKGTAGIVWGAIRTLVTLGAATGELLVQRTAELFGGGGQGRVTITYRPPAQKVAYIGPNSRLHLVNNDSTNQKEISRASDLSYFQWFPDGKRIIYGTSGGHQLSQVFLIDVDTGEEEEIVEVTHFITLAPDGKEFLYWEGTYSDQTLAIFDLNSKSSRLLPIQQTYQRLELGVSLGVTSLAWSPDSKKIAYIDNHFQDPETGFRGKAVWVMDVDTFEKEIIGEATVGAIGKPILLHWAPDGKRLGFLNLLVRQGLGSLTYDLFEILSKSSQTVLETTYEPRFCGGVLPRLMDVHWTEKSATVVISFPEGCWKLISSSFEVEPTLPNPGLWLFKEGKEPKLLSDFSRYAGIDISPDGTFVVFTSESGLYTINIDGSNLRKIAELGLQPLIAP